MEQSADDVARAYIRLALARAAGGPGHRADAQSVHSGASRNGRAVEALAVVTTEQLC